MPLAIDSNSAETKHPTPDYQTFLLSVAGCKLDVGCWLFASLNGNPDAGLPPWNNDGSYMIGRFFDRIEGGVDLRGIEVDETKCSLRKKEISAARQVD